MKDISQTKKPIQEEEMNQRLTDVVDQTLAYYNNNSKGSESQKDPLRKDMMEVMENEASRVKQHNLERLKLQKEMTTAQAMEV